MSVVYFPQNETGRDFVVGDLHGSLGLLQDALSRVGFDPTRDRLFCTGDLIDRGPNSLGCLRLLKEPWFHAVMGNHEAMLLSYLGIRYFTCHSPRDFLQNGGHWVESLTDQGLEELRELAALVAELPLVIRVRHPAGDFNVVHAELTYWDRGLIQLASDASVTPEFAEAGLSGLIWGRDLLQDLYQTNREAMDLHRDLHLDPEFILLRSMQPREPGLSLTYVGHSILKMPMLHRSHLYIDRGAYLNGFLWLIDHAELNLQLEGRAQIDIRLY